MQDEFQVPLNKMSDVATNRLLWKRDFGIDIILQPITTLGAEDTTARVTVRGSTTGISALKNYMTQEGLL